MFSTHLVSLVTFLPLVGALLLLFIPRERKDDLRAAALLWSLVVFGLSAALLSGFEADASFQFRERLAWLPESLGSTYHVGIDGISLWLVLLTTLLTPITLLGAWKYIQKRVKEFLIAMLILETGMIGSLVALDLLLFYVFWELMLIPMYLIIGVWGGERRIYAAVKFFLFTLAGSLLMFVAILVIRDRTGTFDFLALRDFALLGDNLGPMTVFGRGVPWETVRIALFGAFALSFAIKVPIFPFHTWLPDAHTEAPTPGSVILAGVLLKLGTYGFVRFGISLFPLEVQRTAWAFATLAVIGIIYGAAMCLAQTDMKRLIAYSSVSHLGYVMLGIFAVIAGAAGSLISVTALSGAMLQMVGHGLATGGLFTLAGMMVERRHSRLMADYGGVARLAPVLTVFFMIMTLSSIGLPGTMGFIGEFLILAGAFGADPIYGALAATGVVLGAVYMLWLVQRVFYGKPNPGLSHDGRQFPDLSVREWVTVLPLAALIIAIGLHPQPILGRMEPALQRLIFDYAMATGYVP